MFSNRIFTLYSKSLPLDVACRVWDVFCRDGEESLFRVGLGILRLYGDVLLHMDFIHIAQFLSRLPEDLASDTLFTAMANTHMVSGNRRWAQVRSASLWHAAEHAVILGPCIFSSTWFCCSCYSSHHPGALKPAVINVTAMT